MNSKEVFVHRFKRYSTFGPKETFIIQKTVHTNTLSFHSMFILPIDKGFHLVKMSHSVCAMCLQSFWRTLYCSLVTTILSFSHFYETWVFIYVSFSWYFIVEIWSCGNFSLWHTLIEQWKASSLIKSFFSTSFPFIIFISTLILQYHGDLFSTVYVCTKFILRDDKHVSVNFVCDLNCISH